ncbi:MAG: hypothetical protein JWM44_482 [Bacilli bacterium]|nr:hypothetical protein [Bacilli bacterium]
MSQFDQKYSQWLKHNIDSEKNQRRRELLKKRLGHRTVELLRRIWFPVVIVMLGAFCIG